MDYISTARESSDDTDSDSGYHTIPWNEWAPGNVLVTPVWESSSRASFFKTGCDGRALQLIEPDAVKIYDFNRLRVRNASKSGTQTETITGCIEVDWLEDSYEDVFVETFLECTAATYKLPCKADNMDVRLAEDALILIPKDTETEDGKRVRKASAGWDFFVGGSFQGVLDLQTTVGK
ncbi:hypothetical protein OF83DRAFT_1179283 [Amylostereum chailletii]|nr:hypothetical protein OF83DRAFT_1179283 [Amylostereum chailletii]